MSFIFYFKEDLGRGFSEQKLPLPASQSGTKVISIVTFHGKTYINAFPLNDLKLMPNERKANDFSERLNDLANALNGK